MSGLLIDNAAALPFLFTEDLYFIDSGATAGLENPPPEKKPQPDEPPIADSIPFKFLGGNGKNFLILIDDKIHTLMNPAHQEMLLKVMTAKNMELADLAVVNIARYHSADLNDLKSALNCSSLVLFGVVPAQLGLVPFDLNKPHQTSGVKMLATYSLEEMRNNADKKREFWNVMKKF